ncbi:hypothetical protein EZV62_003779 [Acer yangbiense]|uniref:Uncharacterized protein n=1 Tax=Acer yangbiense TaxID=1000413 RepID=A0A5C7IIU5_9ROSI|nr:hypothetical protein EZV62_003779 [Acer yangbiense]
MVFVILGLLVGQSAADFKSCYSNCFVICTIYGGSAVECVAKCLKECTLDTYSSHTLKHTDDFCKLGCATSLCTNLSTKLDPGFKGEATNLVAFQSLLECIRKTIENKKFLLILDDVWIENDDKWGQLYSSLNDGLHGESRILVTTRKEKVAQVMKSIDGIDIGVLTPNDSWLLFKQLALCDRSQEECEKLENIGREIVGKCKGLPLAMTQGYFGLDNDEEIEIIGEEYCFDTLAMHSFFQEFRKDDDGNIYACKMHDIVHDFAHFLVKNECFSKEIYSSEEASLDVSCWEMGWIFVRSHVDLSYKTKFVAAMQSLVGVLLMAQCAEHCRCTFCARLVSAGEFYPSKSSNSSLVVMGIFDFTKLLSVQISFTSYGFNALTNNEMLSPRWMNEVASGNVTSLGVSSQSNAAAGEDSNECKLLCGQALGYRYLDIGANVTIEIVQANWYGSKFIIGPNTYVLFALEAPGMVQTVKSSSKGAATPCSISCNNIDPPYTTRINTKGLRFTIVLLIILRPQWRRTFFDHLVSAGRFCPSKSPPGVHHSLQCSIHLLTLVVPKSSWKATNIISDEEANDQSNRRGTKRGKQKAKNEFNSNKVEDEIAVK